MPTEWMTRGEAAEIIDRVRELLAERRPPEEIENHLRTYFQIPPLTRCDGEAHTNPHIDNCEVCAPRWGWIGERVRVR